MITDLIPAEVVGRIGVSLSTLATWRSSGAGPPYRKIGRKVTYPEAELQAWMDRQIVRGNGHAGSESNSGV